MIAATNRVDIIDPAILRPGRLDKTLFVPLPDCADRLLILHTLVRNTPISDNIDFQILAEKTENFSGADLASLVREAA